MHNDQKQSLKTGRQCIPCLPFSEQRRNYRQTSIYRVVLVQSLLKFRFHRQPKFGWLEHFDVPTVPENVHGQLPHIRKRYLSGAGKSGGQRQKLAATCLAAALRYQLGGSERLYPTFSTVVLDEAFDKADSEFTALAMNIFKNFGFQMVVATPLKNVMALEPFIGGASFVHFLKESKHSVTLKIEYDVEHSRLLLSDKDKAAVVRAQAEEKAKNDAQEAPVA